MANKVVRRRKKGRRGGLAGLLLLFVMVLYVPAMWKWFFTPGVESGIIQEDKLEMKVPVSGVFIRNELVLRSPETGIIKPKARYGEKVPAGGVIASFVDNDAKDMVSQYDSAEGEVLKRAFEAAKAEGDSEVAAIGATVEREAASLSLAANQGDIRQIASIRDSINRVLDEKARSLISKETKGSYLNDEKMEMQKLENRMMKTMLPQAASQPGIVCYSFDGFESEWTPARLETLTVGAIALQPADGVDSHAWVTPEDMQVKKDEPYGKLVYNDVCWFAFQADAKTAKTLANRLEAAKLQKTQAVVMVEIKNVSTRIPLILEAVRSDAENKGNALIIGRMTRYVEQTMELRKVSGDLILQSLEGMKVPQKALFNRNSVDGTADLMLLRMNRAALRRVHVLGIQDSWAIIENLDHPKSGEGISVYDLYLQNPDGVLDGQVMQK